MFLGFVCGYYSARFYKSEFLFLSVSQYWYVAYVTTCSINIPCYSDKWTSVVCTYVIDIALTFLIMEQLGQLQCILFHSISSQCLECFVRWTVAHII